MSLQELAKYQSKLTSTADEYDSIIEQMDHVLEYLTTAKSASQSGIGPTSAATSTVFKTAATKIKENEKEIHHSLNKVAKNVQSALPWAYTPSKPPTFSGPETIQLMDTAIALHLLRRGHIDVVRRFIKENPKLDAGALHVTEFEHMQNILDALDSGNLTAALAWAQEQEEFLRRQGSDLIFILHRIQVLQALPSSGSSDNDAFNPATVLRYIRDHMGKLGSQYRDAIAGLAVMVVGARRNYGSTKSLNLEEEIQKLRTQFVRDYSSWLGMAPESPLALTAYSGAIALPIIEKMRTVMKSRSAEWSSTGELPVEIDLPAALQFHQIFVCPVSKEQTHNENNPPYLLDCGHIISDAAVKRLSDPSVSLFYTFKCPYCPEMAAVDMMRKVIF